MPFYTAALKFDSLEFLAAKTAENKLFMPYKASFLATVAMFDVTISA